MCSVINDVIECGTSLLERALVRNSLSCIVKQNRVWYWSLSGVHRPSKLTECNNSILISRRHSWFHQCFLLYLRSKKRHNSRKHADKICQCKRYQMKFAGKMLRQWRDTWRTLPTVTLYRLLSLIAARQYFWHSEHCQKKSTLSSKLLWIEQIDSRKV